MSAAPTSACRWRCVPTNPEIGRCAAKSVKNTKIARWGIRVMELAELRPRAASQTAIDPSDRGLLLPVIGFLICQFSDDGPWEAMGRVREDPGE